MKTWFSLALLAASVAYTAYGLHTLNLFDMSGRPGAGYFPLIVGVLLIAATSLNAVRDFGERRRAALPEVGRRSETGLAKGTPTSAESQQPDSPDADRCHGIDVFVALCMLFVFIFSLNILGGLASMMTFMLMFLFFFNRGAVVTNVVYSLALPVFLYWLFRIMLNASLPIGLLGF